MGAVAVEPADPAMNMVRGAAVGGATAAAGAATRVPQEPQKANPGAICLPQVAQMTSDVADVAAPAAGCG
jgi:hypothetical protein